MYTTSAEFVVLLKTRSLPFDTFTKTWGFKVHSTQQLHAVSTASITVRPMYTQRKTSLCSVLNVMIPWALHMQLNSEYHMNKPIIDYDEIM
jgi:hypothetical protein